MKKIISRLLLISFLLVSFFTSSFLTVYAATLLSDDFTGNVVSSANWHIPTWSSTNDGTFIGRTQFMCTQNASLPVLNSSNAVITMQTYNPTGTSFYGTDLISNQQFTQGQGIHVTVRAKMNATKPGIVGGIFLYALKPGSTVYRDEIDFELLTNLPNKFNTNIFSNQPTNIDGIPQYISYASGSINDYHTYEIKWLPTQVVWIVDGNVVRTETSNLPTSPMNFHLNLWVPDSGWATAYSSDLNYTTLASANVVYSMSVDSVSVQSIVSNPVSNTITLSPATANLTFGGLTQQITATTFDQNGSPINSALTWASSNTAVATVSSTGLVTPIAPGTANITATSGSVTSTTPSVISVTTITSNANINITSVPALGYSGNAVGRVTGISPSNYSRYAVALYVNVYGGWWTKPFLSAPLTAIQPDGTWSGSVTTGGSDIFSNQIVAYLVPAGYSAPACSGTASLPSSLSSFPMASVSRSSSLIIIVNQLGSTLIVGGQSQQITATAVDQNCNVIDTPLTWTSDNTAVATVSSTGLVTAVAPGTANVTASSGTAVSQPVVITVIKPNLTIIRISPFFATLVVGKTTQQMTASTRDQFNQPITATVTWASDKTSVATVSSTGLVTPIAPGTANITASSGTVTSDPAIITVVKPALTTISITPISANLIANGVTQQLTATKLDQQGNPIIATLIWASDNTAVATVSSTGLVKPISVGTANITASSGGVVSNASVITVVSPTIQITSVPAYGTAGYANGKIVGVLSANYSKYKVAVYIYVNSGWWTKPYLTAPLTTIQSNGTWKTDIATGGVDQNATQVATFLVPTGYSITTCSGTATLPPALQSFPSAFVNR